jgi:agmatinase
MALRDPHAPVVRVEQDLTALRLQLSEDLALESRDEAHAIVVNTASAARLKLSLGAYGFLKAFEHPRRVSEILTEQEAGRLLPHLRKLIDKQMLVDADAPPDAAPLRLRAAVAYKFCGAPAQGGQAGADFVILGVPYDLAGRGDSRLSPTLIRQKSLDYTYQLEFGDGRPRGWFDVNRGVRMLRGATFRDAGDVVVEYGEGRARFEERVAAVTVPLILGGDRSVTAAAIPGIPTAEKLTVVQIAANPDLAAAEGAGRHLARLAHVDRCISLGGSPGAEVDELARNWGEDLPVYLSIDLGTAAEACSKEGAGGFTPGLAVHELKLMIAAIGRNHRILGIDLVGLDLRRPYPELSAVIGCHLALASMSAAHDRF